MKKLSKKSNLVSKKSSAKNNHSNNLNLEIVDASPIGTLIYNVSSGQCIYANQAIAKITGGTIEQLCKLNFRKIVSWKKPGILDSAEKAIKTSKVQIIECDTISTFKKHFWTTVGFKTFNQNGEKFLLAHFTDISERKNHELDLESQMNRYRMLMKTSQDAIHIVDKKGNLIEWNDAFLKHLGYTFTEAAKLNIANWDLKWTRKEFEKIIKSTNENGIAFDTLHRCKNGEMKDVAIRAHKIILDKKELYYASARDITQRKLNERKISDSKERYHNLVSNLHIGILVQGPKAEMLLSNQRALDLLGLTENQLLGKSSFDKSWNVIHEDGSDFPGTTHPVPVCIATRKSVRNVVMGVYRPKTKDRVWLLVNADPLLNNDGTVKEVICTFKDFTDIKNMQFSLKESEDKYHTLFKNMQEGFVFCKLIYKKGIATDFIYLDINDQFQKLTGLKNIKGKRMSELTPGIKNQDSELFKIYERVVKTGIPQLFEYEVKSMKMWFKVSVYRSMPEHFVATFDVITDRKNAEINLQKSEQRFRALIENSSDMIALIDEQSNVKYLSPSVQKYMGWKIKDSIGKRTTEFIHPDDLKIQIETLKKSIKYPNLPIKHVIRFKTAKGKYIWVESVFTNNLKVESINAFVINFRDITERVEAELKLKNEQAQLIKLSANLQESEANTRSVFDNSFTGFALMDRQFNVKLFNQMMQQFIQKEFGENIETKKSMLNFLSGFAYQSLKEELPKVLTGYVFKLEVNYTGISGIPHWYHIRLFPSFDDKKNIVGIILAVSDIHEKKQAEIEQRTNDELLKTIIENTQNLITLTDENDQLIFISTQCKDVVGIVGEEYIGKKMPFPIHTDDIKECLQKWQNLKIKGENILHHEYRLVNDDGSIRWISHSAKNVIIDGKIKYIQSSIRNITERKINEELLRENEYLLKTSQQVSHIGSYVLDMKTRKWKGTKNLAEILGIPFKEEYTNQDWKQIIHPDYSDLTSEYFVPDYNKKNLLFNKEYKIINQQTGAECWVSDIGEIIVENGLSKMYGTMQDINERKKNAELLRESEFLLKTAQEISIIGSYNLDIQKQIWQGSEALYKIFGITPSYDLSVKGWVSIVHPEHRELMEDYFVNEVIAKKNKFNKEYKIQNIENGKTYWVHGIGELSFDKNGIPVKMIGTIQNITERKIAEEQIALKTNELERFNNTMIGRELKMIELKKEINALLTQQGLEKKYKTVR